VGQTSRVESKKVGGDNETEKKMLKQRRCTHRSMAVPKKNASPLVISSYQFSNSLSQTHSVTLHIKLRISEGYSEAKDRQDTASDVPGPRTVELP
jgi:hypothetical protein